MTNSRRKPHKTIPHWLSLAKRRHYAKRTTERDQQKIAAYLNFLKASTSE